GLYQPAETLTHRRHRLRRARRQYLIGPLYVFAMDAPVGRRQDESGSASFGISHHANTIPVLAAARLSASRRMRSIKRAGRNVSLSSTDGTPEFNRSRALALR